MQQVISKNNKSIPPIIFIHYGNSPYLKYTLEAAKRTNPNKEIILLGDRSNKKYANNSNVTFYPFKDFRQSELISRFNSVYRHIAGEEHGRKNWTYFVFLRWFIIYDFLLDIR